MRCSWADHVMVVNLDGFTRPCCQASSSTAIMAPISIGIKNAWNSPKLNDLRNELDIGYTTKIKNICSRCYNAEKLGLDSLRINSDFFPNENNTLLKGIQFKLSNRCQLTCAHCEPYLSSSWGKLQGKSVFIHDAIKQDQQDKLINELIEILPSLEWIRFTGGEPWMDPLHWKILERLSKFDRSKCELGYITNGLATFDSDLWSGWKAINITLSIDGHKESFEWFRRGANWNKLVNVTNILTNIKNVNLKISYCITPWTVTDWDKAKEFWKLPIAPQPVVMPWHSSLTSLSTDMIDLPPDTPFIDLIGKHPVEIKKLRQWAIEWDTIWDTKGWSEKIHPWVFKC